jgi:hypothetical protein
MTKPADSGADIDRLVAHAVRTGDPHTWTLEHLGAGLVLQQTAQQQWRLLNGVIVLSRPVALALERVWKRNQHGAYIGHRSLKGVLKLLGDTTDVKAQIFRAQLAEEERARVQLAAARRLKLAGGLRGLLDLMEEGTEDILLKDGTVMEPQMVMGLNAFLNRLTRDDAACAQAAAYRVFWPHDPVGN